MGGWGLLPRLVGHIRGTSRLLLLSGSVLGAVVLWTAVTAVHPIGPPTLLWIATPASALVATAIFWRTSRSPGLPLPTRRFWRRLTLAVVMVGIASTSQAVDVTLHPDVPGPHNGPVLLTFDTIALTVVIWALYRLPFGRQTLGELTRMVLDAGTVMLAAAAFMWHFQTRPLLDSADRSELVASLVLTVLALFAVFAVAKVMLSGYTFIQGKGLRLLAIAMAIGAFTQLLEPVLKAMDPGFYPMQIGIPGVYFFAAWAAEHQRHVVVAPRRNARGGARRSFSFLPYAAVAAVDGLLIYVSWFDRADEPLVVASAVLLTALVVARQITALRDNGRLLARLDHGATHDALTQLPNRALFHDRLQKALAAPVDRAVAVALIDLDDFKEVNDTLGHEVGDVLLISVARRLQTCLRSGDTVARLGGDEFVVVLEDADPAAADLAAERMIEALRRPVLAEGHELPIRASIGIADGRGGDEASKLLRHADIAMYAAKKIPGTAHLHFDESMAASGADYAQLGAELREAIHDDQLFLLYQPIVSLDDGRVIGAEALVRWAHPVRGTLAPDSFIPAAERTGLIVPLSRWVLASAFRQLAEWIERYGDDAPEVLNVNISARDLREPGFATMVTDLLAQHRIAPEKVTLEITETVALELGDSVAHLHQLRESGIRIALDDFGTGHSTLSLLHDCPVDGIKLDRSFTQSAIDGRVPVSAAVIHLAQALGLYAVAEGVETAEQAEQLLALGYIAAQGYHFARPLPPERFAESLRPRDRELAA
ncbi:putative bifunctional diguanylate cyclase/phosphodiesterase [Mangrovihabitans endophyticus]|uniref:Diguanylate cyclase (GGDEF) domain-containing protein n=1 Tax=Mangrovihabitans endophyticus TaxID=1751298 RepID=A0A8J3BZV7_9ACTN|nr:EAL domain-containing protein [Mangrovihabitans endophyticus]GGK97963.1 hypothetical protein GCM10012284_35260 [Mangrovihabitans endophyticus]